MWKLFKYIGILIVFFSITWFLSGVFRFPGAPISLCGEEKYCNKQGQIVSKEDYESFQFWHTSLIITHPLAMLMIFLLYKFKDKTK